MNGRLIAKITIDVLMAILFIKLIDVFATGLAFHEIVGLSTFALFILHTILNWSWVKSITLKLFSSKLKTSVKLKYSLNIFLFLGVSTIVITGVMISEILFPSGTVKSEGLYFVHKWTSYLCLGLFAIHIVIHARYLVHSILKILTSLNQKSVRNTFLRLGAASLLAVLLYTRVISAFTENTDTIVAQNYESATISYQATARTEDTAESLDEYPASTQNNSTSSDSGDTSSSTNMSGSLSTSTVDTYITSSEIDTTFSDTTAIGATVTLSDYLSNLHCTVCHKHCSLLYPQCDKANREIQSATAEYQELYGV